MHIEAPKCETGASLHPGALICPDGRVLLINVLECTAEQIYHVARV